MQLQLQQSKYCINALDSKNTQKFRMFFSCTLEKILWQSESYADYEHFKNLITLLIFRIVYIDSLEDRAKKTTF